MSETEPLNDSAVSTESDSTSNSSSNANGQQAPATVSRLRMWHLMIAALVAAGLAWPLVKHFEKSFPMANLTVEETNLLRANPDDPVAWAKERQNFWDSLSRNSMLNFGCFGCCLGLCLGLVSAFASRQSIVALLQNLLYGAGLGTVGGAGGGLAAAAMANALRNSREMDVTIRSSLIHGAGWIVPGLACGVILWVTCGERRLGLLSLGGLLGGLLAAMLYEPIAGILFQLDRTDLPMPEGTGNKYLFLAMAGVLMALGAKSATSLPAVRVAAPRG